MTVQPPDWATKVPNYDVHNVPAQYVTPPMSQLDFGAYMGAIAEAFIGQIAIAFGGIEILGWKPFEFLQQWGQNLVNQATGALTGVTNLSGAVVNGLGGSSSGKGLDDLVAEAETALTNLGKFLGRQNFVSGAFNLGEAIARFITNLLHPAGVVTTDTQIPASQLAILAPGASKNVLRDPGFVGPQTIQGQSQWLWDYPGVPHFNSVRTVRNGVIFVFYVGGTYTGLLGDLQPVPDFPFYQWLWMGIPPDVLNAQTDPPGTFPPRANIDVSRFQFISVPYPGSNFPENVSIANGVENIVGTIQQLPKGTKFILAGLSQGCTVISNVYDELRYGRLQDRQDDFLRGINYGNPRRQNGITFIDPVYGKWPDPSPNTSGMSPWRLQNCDQTKWMELYHGLDICAATNDDPNDLEAIWIRNEFAIINEQFGLILPLILGGPQVWVAAFQAFWAIYTDIFGGFDANSQDPATAISPHHQFWWTGFCPFGEARGPFAAGSGATGQGDTRAAAEIMCDLIQEFAPLVDPPLVGERRMIEGELFQVQPLQVIHAGATVKWINVDVPPDYVAARVGINCYDANMNWIGNDLVEAAEATIVGPDAYEFNGIRLEADFDTPPGTKYACLAFDVQPEAMTTGDWWFGNAVFEPTTILDAELLGRLQAMGMIGPNQVTGPLGEADLLTAYRNLVDYQTAALNQAGLTEAQFTDLITAQGQNAKNAADALALAVAHQQQLSNATSQPLYTGGQPTGEVTFPLTSLPQGTALPVTIVPTGTAVAGVITCAQAVKKGFIKTIAQDAGGTGIYINIYNLDQTTGQQTRLWSSGDIAGDIPSGHYANISEIIAGGIQTTQGQRVFAELANASGHDVSVVIGGWGIPNDTDTIPPNIGYSRSLAATGGISPNTLAQGSLTFSGKVPYFCFGVKDVPVDYQPPDRKNFSTPGLYPVELPAWIEAGDLIDGAALGGGGGGGPYANSKNGQGGYKADWEFESWVYGTDIPLGAQLYALVAAGGTPNADGNRSVIGYGLEGPPAFNAAGNITHLSQTRTFTAPEGSLVVLVVTWGGVTTQPSLIAGFAYGDRTDYDVFAVAGISGQSTGLAIVGFWNAPGGEQTIQLGGSNVTHLSIVPLAYTGVYSAGVGLLSSGTTQNLSHSATCQEGQRVIQAFGLGFNAGTLSGLGGGTNRIQGDDSGYAALTVSDATEDTTFTATFSATSPKWLGASVILNPILDTVLLGADGGEWGGNLAAGATNPDNPNATSNGIGADNEMYQGHQYPGGVTVGPGTAGSPPGGGGGGGTSAATNGAPGAGGYVSVTARQPTS